MILSFKEEIEELFLSLLSVEILQNLLALKTSNTNAPVDESNAQGGRVRRAQTFGEADSKSAASTWKCKTDVLCCFVCGSYSTCTLK